MRVRSDAQILGRPEACPMEAGGLPHGSKAGVAAIGVIGALCVGLRAWRSQLDPHRRLRSSEAPRSHLCALGLSTTDTRKQLVDRIPSRHSDHVAALEGDR